jgi:hypothetical protein
VRVCVWHAQAGTQPGLLEQLRRCNEALESVAKNLEVRVCVCVCVYGCEPFLPYLVVYGRIATGLFLALTALFPPFALRPLPRASLLSPTCSPVKFRILRAHSCAQLPSPSSPRAGLPGVQAHRLPQVLLPVKRGAAAHPQPGAAPAGRAAAPAQGELIALDEPRMVNARKR